MSVSRIAKIQLMVTRQWYPEFMNALHKGGFIEVEGWQREGADLQYRSEDRSHYWETNVKFVIDVLKPLAEAQKKKWFDKFSSGIHEISVHEIESLMKEYDYKKVVEQVTTIDKESQRLKNLISQHKRDIKSLKMWAGLPSLDIGRRQFISIFTGSLPIVRFDDFCQQASDMSDVEVIKVGESDKEVHILLVYTHDAEERINQLCLVADFKKEDVDLQGAASVDERLHVLAESIHDLERLQTEQEQKMMVFVSDIDRLKVVSDYLTWKSQQSEVSQLALATRETVVIRGWVQARRLADLEQILSEITTEFDIEQLEPEEGESIPVALENNRLVTPFESVTDIYGAPQYNEPDPTVYLAPFFILYFALCLTDAGYGLVLAIMSFVALKLMRPKGGAKKMMKLMIIGGLMTFFVGMLFGGWFGIVLDDLPPGRMRDILLSVRLIDPVANPMAVLILSFILGFIQLVVGNIVSAAWKIRHGAVRDGLLSSGAWAVFLLVVGFWVAVKVGVLPMVSADVAQYVLYAGLAFQILAQGSDGANIFSKLFKGLASLYGLVGYLSDILSYSRLLALGLSTGIIAMVVNIIASLFADMVPFVGPVVWWAIIIGGHLFNLAINVLGAFIHSGRLQFVEYFPKFLAGGGRKFKPLVRTTKYISVVAGD